MSGANTSDMSGAKHETIYALASAFGRAGVAIVRISGDLAGPALLAVTSTSTAKSALPEPRLAVRRRVFDPRTGETLDDALALWFVGPASFTGEDVAELHIHGGPAVIEGVLSALSNIDGLRLAEPGEFTRRAFDHGKLDLTQVEGLADLIEAETEAQRRQALRQAEGKLGELYDGWRNQLVRALAHFEAELDFSDEELPEDVHEKLMTGVHNLHSDVQNHLSDGRQGERLREGYRIAIIGPPNAGKSSLMNALAQRDAAIVSSVAGTTRDIVEVHLNLGGFPVLFADTAGLRESEDHIEAEGVRRAKAWAESADLKLAVFDGDTLPQIDSETIGMLDSASIIAMNKADHIDLNLPESIVGFPVLALSVKSGRGLDDLISQLTAKVSEGLQTTSSGPAPTRARHRVALQSTEAALLRFLNPDLGAVLGSELEAEDLRLAARELGRITGRVNVEDLLDVIFRDFCIGK